jgi:hypothetical protein
MEDALSRSYHVFDLKSADARICHGIYLRNDDSVLFDGLSVDFL